jgi:hypothetical protein
LSQTLSTSGADLSRVENLDFWVLIDTSPTRWFVISTSKRWS